jgi:predicted HTH transcriptional regulator
VAGVSKIWLGPAQGKIAVNDSDFEELLASGYESRGVEFKPAGPRTDKFLFAKVTRAALGMSNRRDGGTIIIGIESVNNTPKPTGLVVSDLSTWSYDDVATNFAAYADPSLTFDFEIISYRGSQYVVLRIHEFEDIPVLCKKDFNKNSDMVLRKGACYVRSRHKPETSEIPTQEDMRDLLDLATDKGVRKFMSRATRAGLLHFASSEPSTQSDEDLYKKELGDLA